MADNNNNQDFDIMDDANWMSDFVQSIINVNEALVKSVQMLELVHERLLKGVEIADRTNMTNEEINKSFETYKDSFREAGLLTKDFEKKIQQLQKTVIDSRIQDPSSKVRADVLEARFAELTTQAKVLTEAFNASKGKEGAKFFKKSNTVTAKELDIIVAKAMKIGLDQLSYNMNYFFSQFEQNDKRNRRTFASELIEGLAANKFIGGAINDTFRLVGFYGASMIKQIPLIGKFLAPVFYGVMQALGPILTQAVITGVVQGIAASLVGNLVTGLLGRLGGGLIAGQAGSQLLNKGAIIGWGSRLGQVTARTVPAAATITGIGTMGTVAGIGGAAQIGGQAGGIAGAQTVANMAANPVAQAGLRGALATTGKVAGRVLPGLGVLIEGGSAIGEWKKGNKGKASMHGLSAALGAGAIAAGATGVGAPIALILGALSLIAALIGIFMKDSKKNAEKTNEYQEFMKDTGAWMRNGGAQESLLSTYGGSNTIGAEVKENLKNKPTTGSGDDRVARTIGKLQLDKGGAILNAQSFTQSELAKQLELYRKTDPTGFNNLYEEVKQGDANLNSFTTDAVFKDAKGQKTGALLYKGATNDLSDLRRMLMMGGMSEEKANQLMYSSGMMTGSNKKHSFGKWKSHANKYGYGFDLGAPQWTQKDWEMAAPIMKNFYAAKGFDANYEVNGSFTNPALRYDREQSHEDVKPMKDWKPTGAFLNEAASSTQHTLDINEAIKSMPRDKKDKYVQMMKENPYNGNSQEDLIKYHEDLMNKLSSTQGSSPFGVPVPDVTGNTDFLQMQSTMSAYSKFGCDQTRIG